MQYNEAAGSFEYILSSLARNKSSTFLQQLVIINDKDAWAAFLKSEFHGGTAADVAVVAAAAA